MIFCQLQDEQEPEGEDLVDSEEYDEDEEEERRRKKRKKDSRYGGFIIDEAEVSFLCHQCLFIISFCQPLLEEVVVEKY